MRKNILLFVSNRPEQCMKVSKAAANAISSFDNSSAISGRMPKSEISKPNCAMRRFPCV